MTPLTLSCLSTSGTGNFPSRYHVPGTLPTGLSYKYRRRSKVSTLRTQSLFNLKMSSTVINVHHVNFFLELRPFPSGSHWRPHLQPTRESRTDTI